MSDRFMGKITIGGPIPPDKLHELAAKIADDGPYEEVETEDGILFLTDYQASYGTFDSLEDWLKENGVPFERESAAYGEYDAERVSFRPGMHQLLWERLDADGREVIHASVIGEAIFNNDGSRRDPSVAIEEILKALPEKLPDMEKIDEVTLEYLAQVAEGEAQPVKSA